MKPHIRQGIVLLLSFTVLYVSANSEKYATSLKNEAKVQKIAAVKSDAKGSKDTDSRVKRAYVPKQPAYLPLYKVRKEAKDVYRKHLNPAVEDIESMLSKIEGKRYLTDTQKGDLGGEVRSILDHLMEDVVNLLKPYLNNQTQLFRQSFPRKVMVEIRGMVHLIEQMEDEAKDILAEASQLDKDNRHKYAEEPSTMEIQQKAAHVLDDFLKLKLKVREVRHEFENNVYIDKEDRTAAVAALRGLVTNEEKARIKGFLKPIARSRKFEVLYPIGTMERIHEIEAEVDEWVDQVEELQDGGLVEGQEEDDEGEDIERSFTTVKRRYRRSVLSEDRRWRGAPVDEVLDMMTAKMKQVYRDLVETKKTFLQVTALTQLEDLNDDLNAIQSRLKIEFKDKYKYFSVNRHCTDQEDIQGMFDALDAAELQIVEIQERLQQRVLPTQRPVHIPETLPIDRALQEESIAIDETDLSETAPTDDSLTASVQRILKKVDEKPLREHILDNRKEDVLTREREENILNARPRAEQPTRGRGIEQPDITAENILNARRRQEPPYRGRGIEQPDVRAESILNARPRQEPPYRGRGIEEPEITAENILNARRRQEPPYRGRGMEQPDITAENILNARPKAEQPTRGRGIEQPDITAENILNARRRQEPPYRGRGIEETDITAENILNARRSQEPPTRGRDIEKPDITAENILNARPRQEPPFRGRGIEQPDTTAENILNARRRQEPPYRGRGIEQPDTTAENILNARRRQEPPYRGRGIEENEITAENILNARRRQEPPYRGRGIEQPEITAENVLNAKPRAESRARVVEQPNVRPLEEPTKDRGIEKPDTRPIEQPEPLEEIIEQKLKIPITRQHRDENGLVLQNVVGMLRGRVDGLSGLLRLLKQAIMDSMAQGELSPEGVQIFEHRLGTLFTLMQEDVINHLSGGLEGKLGEDDPKDVMAKVQELDRVLDDLEQEANSIRGDLQEGMESSEE